MTLPKMFNETVKFIKQLYNNSEFVSLHAPVFLGNEKKYLENCINSTYVSYVGEYVSKFEEITKKYVKSRHAIAVVNGTVAIQVALELLDVNRGDEVITQPLTFVATVNAISHAGAIPVFVDVDLDTLGISPEKLSDFIAKNYLFTSDGCINKTTHRKLKAIVPMHTFGHPCRIDEIVKIAKTYNLVVVEDSAESIGSFYKGQHTGTFGDAGIISYNGNKTITTGGGGMIITNNETFAKKVNHFTTTGKLPHPWEFIHDIVAYNFRLTNVNAALGVAQMEYINRIINNKRETAELYKEFFKGSEFEFVTQPLEAESNYWLNAIKLQNIEERNKFLKYSNENGVQSRPAWRLMNKLDMYQHCQSGNLDNACWLEERIVNIPSGYRF